MDSLERASDALQALEGTTQEAFREACASLEERASVGGPPNTNQVVSGPSSTKIDIGPPLPARRSSPATSSAYKARLPDRLVLGSYAKQMEWARPLVDTSTPGQDAARLIIIHWNPFNKRNSSVAHMRKLYPNNLRILVVARVEDYSIPIPSYMDKKSYQHVAEEGMYIRNHDFDETVELVWLNF